MNIEFQSCELCLYVITLEVEMYLHDYGDINSPNCVWHCDERIVSIFTSKDYAFHAFDNMKAEDFFTDTQLEYDVESTKLRIKKYITINGNEATEEELLSERSII